METKMEMERRFTSVIPPADVTHDVVWNESKFGFLIGSALGLHYHLFSKKSRPAGSPLVPRLRHALTRAPLAGLNIGSMFCLRVFLEHSLIAIRHKDDPLNAFASGAVSAGLLLRRCRPVTASVASLLAGSCFAVYDAVCERSYDRRERTIRYYQERN